MINLFRKLISIGILVLALSPLTVNAAERHVLKEAEVRQVISDYLRQKTEHQGVEILVKKTGFSGEVALPAGNTTYEVVAPQDWEGWGRGSLALIVRVNDRVEKNIPLYVEVEALANVVVSTRPLERGELLEKGDVLLQRRDMATTSGRVCRNLDEALGMRVRVGMRANFPVRGDYLERPPLVKSGQMVTIVAENKAFRITATGTAKGNGAEGDTVMVRNMNAQKDVPAVVVDANTVRVEF
ncbi:MAG: flagellar basal body P-ring formation chaperone FlgA [Desulfobacteraceae bacterium]|nr:flagellar basal body P-ring formation chaperone FlgA [Desulfobacteraceae bacterium]